VNRARRLEKIVSKTLEEMMKEGACGARTMLFLPGGAEIISQPFEGIVKAWSANFFRAFSKIVRAIGEPIC
jgi:hypothetical protein